MDSKLVREINRLWLPVYPGIATQVAESLDKAPLRILEVGAFSGGIGLSLLRMFPASSITIALEISELVRSFRSDWAEMLGAAGKEKVRIVSTPLVPLDIPDGSHDLVICRGVFFFLDPSGTHLRDRPGALKWRDRLPWRWIRIAHANCVDSGNCGPIPGTEHGPRQESRHQGGIRGRAVERGAFRQSPNHRRGGTLGVDPVHIGGDSLPP
jgi:hypothetical protein